MKKYSIGEFAKHLGVTPDFLKYYEKMGILLPTVNESGYRLFQFWERGQVIECIKLRNCGFSSREVVELLNAGSLEEYVKKIRERQLQLKDQLDHLCAQMIAFDSLSALSHFFDLPSNWEVTKRDGFYFLPQADFDDFYADRSVDAAMKSWTPWMPTVKSTLRYERFEDDPRLSRTPKVGFTVSESFAREHNLYIKEPVEYVQPQRWLTIYLKDQTSRPEVSHQERYTKERQEKRQMHNEIAHDIVQKHSFTVLDSEYYIIKLLQLCESDIQTNYSIMQIPIE